MHLLMDSAGHKLRSPVERLTVKHSVKRHRVWRVLTLVTDVDIGRIVALVLTDRNADDGFQVDPLFDRVDGSVASFTGDGAYDHDGVYAEAAVRHLDVDVIVPP